MIKYSYSLRQKKLCHAAPLRISRNFWCSICLSFCNFMRRCWQGRPRREEHYLFVRCNGTGAAAAVSALRLSRGPLPPSGFMRVFHSSGRERHLACAEGLFRSRASSGPIPPTRHPPAHHQTNIRQGQLSDAGTNKCTGFEG